MMRQISYREVMHMRRSAFTLGYDLENRMAIYINCQCKYQSFQVSILVGASNLPSYMAARVAPMF